MSYIVSGVALYATRNSCSRSYTQGRNSVRLEQVNEEISEGNPLTCSYRLLLAIKRRWWQVQQQTLDVAAYRFAELLHEDSELAAELAADADERQLADLLDRRIALEYLLDERVSALGHQCS